MNEGMTQTAPEHIPNPNERLAQLKTELVHLLTPPHELAEFLTDASLLDSLIEEIGRIVSEMHRAHNEVHPDNTVATRAESEDKILQALGLPSIPMVLAELHTLQATIHEDIPRILQTAIIITPPDANTPVIAHEGDHPHHTPELVPRLSVLLAVLLHELHTPKEQLRIRRGIVTDDMYRSEPYVSVYTPTPQPRLIVVCDEAENRTDIFDMAHPACAQLGVEEIEHMSKQQKDDFGVQHPGAHKAINQSERWSERIMQYLTHPLSDTPKEIIATSSDLTTEEGTAFFRDPQGKRWGSLTAITSEIASQALMRDSDFQTLLREMQTKIATPGYHPLLVYCYEDIVTAMQQHETLSAWFRKTGERRLYRDEEGKHWGSQFAIAAEVGPWVLDEAIWGKLKNAIRSQKIIAHTQPTDAYAAEDIRDHLRRSPELSVYLRTADKETKLYTDSAGDRWGGQTTITQAVFNKSAGLLKNDDYKTFLKTVTAQPIYVPPRTTGYNMKALIAAAQTNERWRAYLKDEYK